MNSETQVQSLQTWVSLERLLNTLSIKLKHKLFRDIAVRRWVGIVNRLAGSGLLENVQIFFNGTKD